MGADVARAIAALSVVAIHCVQWLPQQPHTATDDFYHAADRITRFAVPAFVMLSGALLQLGYAERARGWDFLRRRFTRSLLPWIVWAAVYAAAGTFLTKDVAYSGGLLGWFWWGTGHLWFLLVIPQLYLVFAVWPRRHLWFWACIALAVQLALSVFRLTGPSSLGTLAAQFTLWHGFQLFPFWLGYFALGIAMAQWIARGDYPARLVMLLAFSTAAFAVLLVQFNWSWARWSSWNIGTGSFVDPFMLPFAVSATALLAAMGGRWVKAETRTAAIFRMFSDYSLAIYILHPLVLNIAMGPLLGRLLSLALPVAILGLLMMVLSVYLITALVARFLTNTPLAATLGLQRNVPVLALRA